MTRNELNLKLSAVLEALLDGDEVLGTPETIVALPFAYEDWRIIRAVLLRGGFVAEANQCFRLTEHGRRTAEKSKAFYAAQTNAYAAWASQAIKV